MGYGHRLGERAGISLALVLSACGGASTDAPVRVSGTTGGEATSSASTSLIAAPTDSVRGIPADVLFATALRDGLVDLRFSPDGRLVAMAGADGSVTLVDASTGLVRASRRLRVRGEGGLDLAFRDEGRTLLVATLGWDDPTDDVFAWDLEHDEVRTLVSIDGSEGEARGVAFSPDGRFVAFSLKPSMREGDSEERPSIVRVLDTETGRALDSRTVAPNPRVLLVTDEGTPMLAGISSTGPDYAPTRSADGRRVVSSSLEEGTSVLDSSTGEVLSRLPASRVAGGIPRLSPNGSCLATSTTRGELVVLPVPGNVPLRIGRARGEVAVLSVADDCASVLVLTSPGGLVRRHGARLAQREIVAVDGSVTHLVDLAPGSAVMAATSGDASLAAIALGSHLSIVDLAHHSAAAFVDENGSERSLWQARFEGEPARLAVRGRNWGVSVSANAAHVTEAASVEAEDDDEADRSVQVASGTESGASAVLLVSLEGRERTVPMPGVDARACTEADYASGRCPGVQAELAPDDRHVAVVDRSRRLHVIALGTDSAEARVAEPVADVQGAIFSDDGSALVLRRTDGSLAHLRLGGNPIPLVDARATVAASTLDESTRDVRYFAVRIENVVHVFDARTGVEVGHVGAPSGSTSLAVDSEGRARVGYPAPLSTLVFDAPGGRTVTIEGRIVGIASDFSALASCASGRLFFALAPTSPAPRAVDVAECSDTTSVSFRADGEVAVVQGATTVDLVRLDGSARARLRFHRDEDHVTVVAIDPEGQHFALPAHARDFTVRAPSTRLLDATLSEPDPARFREDLLSPFFTP